MLTRLKIKGFKSLLDVDVRFGPFTCIAGLNGAGKSNLFDAIVFLSHLANKSLAEAGQMVRSDDEQSTSKIIDLFYQYDGKYTDQIEFDAEMIVPRSGTDDLGQDATATTTFLKYSLTLGHSKLSPESSGLTIIKEELNHFTKSDSKSNLMFPHSASFRDSLGIARRTGAFLSTVTSDKGAEIKIHQDLSGQGKSGGRTRSVMANRLPRTVLSTATALETPTMLLAKREMESWKLLQLEPSAMRTPDRFNSPSRISSKGGHLPSALWRMCLEVSKSHPHQSESALRAKIANRLSQLVEGVKDIQLEKDERRELISLIMTDLSGTRHNARSLSDGTLRFLALSILENDSDAVGLLCLEEPENGIHPDRIPAILELIHDLAVDPHLPVNTKNPLRQVIINTHSPSVVAALDDSDLLLAMYAQYSNRKRFQTDLWHMGNTWRDSSKNTHKNISKGFLFSYLNPFREIDRYEHSDPSKLRGIILNSLVQTPTLPGLEPWLQ